MPDDEPIRPDDITDEERKAAVAHADRLMPERALAAQNALRDRRVRVDERERILRRIAEGLPTPRASLVPGEVNVLRIVLAAIREGGQR